MGTLLALGLLWIQQTTGFVKLPEAEYFMDRAAVAIGSAMIHLGVELNWHQLFQDLLPVEK